MPDTSAPEVPRAVRRRPSIALRLSLGVAFILMLVASAALWSAWRYGIQAANEAYDRLLTGASLQIAERINVVDGEVLVDLPASAFELLSLARNDRVFYRVLGMRGETVTGYPDLPSPASNPVGAALQVYETEYSGERVRAVMTTRPIAERGTNGNVRVIVAHTVQERLALARDIASRAAILVGVGALTIVLIAWFAMRYALAPLRRVERALLSRDPYDLSPFEIESPRELEAVVDAINRFTRRLDRRITQVQSFVADAAHQLRTPITAIRAQAQIAVDEESPERLRLLSRRILDRSVAVSRLADQLLSHALVTHLTDSEPRALVDLRRIAIEADEETRRFADGVTELPLLDLTEEPVMVAGDRFSLREAIKNLTTNALEHGRPPVAIRVSTNGQLARIAVIDHGLGIPYSDRASAGSRFSRHRTTSSRGANLGLAIAQEVAVSHGGELQFSDREAGGFEVALSLPLAERVQ